MQLREKKYFYWIQSSKWKEITKKTEKLVLEGNMWSSVLELIEFKKNQFLKIRWKESCANVRAF